MTWAKAILGALAALPEFIGMVKDLLALIKKARDEKWTQDGRTVVKAIKESKSDVKRRRLVKELARTTRNM